MQVGRPKKAREGRPWTFRIDVAQIDDERTTQERAKFIVSVPSKDEWTEWVELLQAASSEESLGSKKPAQPVDEVLDDWRVPRTARSQLTDAVHCASESLRFAEQQLVIVRTAASAAAAVDSWVKRVD